MMEKRIKLAGIPIKIHTLYDSLLNIESYETAEAPFFTVSTTGLDILAEQRKCMAEAAYEDLPYPAYSPPKLENTAVYRKIADALPDYDGFVFHDSAVAVREQAYLFTARSGMGKSTHTALWLKNIPGSYIVNGDKPVIRLIGGRPFICGTPLMGKEGYGCNRMVPLSAICFLNRGKENRIEATEFRNVYPRLIGQSYRPENAALMVKTIELLKKIGKCVPIYELFCNMEDEAALGAFKGMSDDEI